MLIRQAFPRSLVCALALGTVLVGGSAVAPAAPPGVDEAIAASEGLSFDAFVEESYRQLMLRDPDTLWGWELESTYGLESFAEWTDLSPTAFEETCRLDVALLGLLHAFDRDELAMDQRLTYDVYEWFLEDRIRRHAFPYWDYVIGPSSYGVHNLALDLLASVPIDTVERAEDYVERLRGIGAWMGQLLAAFRAREVFGVIPPKLAIDMTLAELDDVFPPQSTGGCNPTSLAVYISFEERLDALDSLPVSTKSVLLADARDAIETALIPAFRAFRDHVASLAGRAGGVGVHEYDRGAEYYDVLLQHHVSASITPDEIRRLGEREVARLQAEMRAFAEDVLGWPSGLTMAELDDRLTSVNVPILQGNALLAEYERLVAEADAKLDTVFDVRPESDLVITVDLDGPPAYYREPPVDKSGPGQVVTSLVNFVAFSAYDEPVLMHHEGVPGHHFQLALARDLDLPSFRRDLVSNVYTRHPTFQACSEGWALYAEPLAVEMGLYEADPIGRLCQLRLELVRIARLVADAGLNALGWSWGEAAAYLTEVTGRAVRATESLRYAAYPGQACAYDVGYLTFLDLRQRATDALGEAFDLKEFHRVVLMNGVIPLEILERVIEDWLAGKAEDI